MARLLEPAEGRHGVEGTTVDLDLAAADAAGDGLGPLGIARPDAGRQAVDGVVGDADGVVLVLVGNDREDGPEDLLLGDRHVVAHVGEHRRPHEVALVEAIGCFGPTGEELGSFVDALLDVAAHPLALGLRYERAETGVGVERIARRVRLGRLHGDLLSFCEARTRDEHARQRAARLAGVEEGLADAIGDGLLEVGVLEDDVGRLATELEGDGLHRLRRQLAHALARAGGAGEGDHVDAGVSCDRLAHDGPGARHEVEDTGRQAYFVDDLGQDEGVEGRDLARLEHDGAPRRQRGRHLVGDLVEWIVPRRDGTDDADGLLDDEGVADLLFEVDLVDDLGHGAERDGGEPGLNDHREVDRHPQFLGDHVGDVHGAGLQALGDALQVLRTLLRRRGRPTVEGGLGRLRGLVDILRCGFGHTAHDLLGGGVDHIDGLRP